jgi:cell division protein FtsZ
MMSEIIPFKIPTDPEKIIKVVGVGGGGGNAVTHMYKEGIHDVSFVLCNTDQQALLESAVPLKVMLGRNVTCGLGAGNIPEKAEEAARESEDEVRTMLNDGTKMVFITAGMGGGTGTGAAPVIAEIAKGMGILTVGIVTIPFLFEGYSKIVQALDGVEKMSKNVDALLVVNNERLSDIYKENVAITVSKAFAKANDTLTVAAKSISELITLPGTMNLDFADVNTTLKNGGIALMSAGYGTGENRLEIAIKSALDSPLLNNNDILHAKRILFQISSSSDEQFELRVIELDHIKKFMKAFKKKYINLIWGLAFDDTLGEQIKFTVLASGFGIDEILTDQERKDIIRKKEEEEEEAEIAIRIAAIYGNPDAEDKLLSRMVILTIDEMDDSNLITKLEEHPTYDRDPDIISKARVKTAPGELAKGETPSSGTSIRFKKNNSITD